MESAHLNNRDRNRLLLKNNKELNSEVDSFKNKIKYKDKNSLLKSYFFNLQSC